MTYALLASEHMIDSQLLTGAVLDERLLAVLASVDRSRFVPDLYVGSAYVDGELPLGDGRFLLEPLTFGRMLALAEITARDTVLDVACGTGYSTMVLSRLAARAVGVESHPALATEAARNIAAFGAANALIIQAPLAEGYHPAAPYDAVLIEGCAELIPASLIDQLREGGRLVVIEKVRDEYEGRKQGKLVRYLKRAGHLDRREAFDAAAVRLDELKGRERFTF